MIEVLLNVRIPELWVTTISERYDIKLSCQIGGQSNKGGWGFATARGNDEMLDKALEEMRHHPSVGDIKIKSREHGFVSFIVDVVKCKACEVLMKSKAFMVFPVDIHKGRMKWLIITDDNKTMGKVYNGLEKYGCNVKIERVTSLGGKGILTKRQEEVIREALLSGYFDYPKKTDSMNLANKLGISTSTLSEIIRAAQRRVFAEYMRA